MKKREFVAMAFAAAMAVMAAVAFWMAIFSATL